MSDLCCFESWFVILVAVEEGYERSMGDGILLYIRSNLASGQRQHGTQSRMPIVL